MKQRYDMTPEQHAFLLERCKPVPYMVFGGMEPRSPQENANDAWATLGRELGFDPFTVEPIPGAPETAFMAEPTKESP